MNFLAEGVLFDGGLLDEFVEDGVSLNELAGLMLKVDSCLAEGHELQLWHF